MTSTSSDLHDLKMTMHHLEGKLTGEKSVTRQILEQTHRNAIDVIRLRPDMDRVSTDVTVIRASQLTQKTRLDHLHEELAEVRAMLEALEKRIDTGFDAIMAAIRAAGPHASPST